MRQQVRAAVDTYPQPGASSLVHILVTRTSLLRAVRTRGAGQLAPGPHARYVRTTRASPGRAVRTAYRVVHHRHATQKLTFNDTLNLLILKESNKATLRAFSTSQIGGA